MVEQSEIKNGLLCPVTVADAMARTVALAPDIEAIVASDGRLTYAELAEEVTRLRHALTHHGVRRGDHVGICLGNSVRFQALFMALATIGAVSVPINTRLRAPEIAYCLQQAKVKVLFAAQRVLSSDFTSILDEVFEAQALPNKSFPHLTSVVLAGETMPVWASPWQEFAAHHGGEQPDTSSAEDIILIQYTSGSTGFPKGVQLRQHSLLTNGFVSAQRIGLHVGDRFHSARPFFHVAGTSLSIMACLQHGVTLVTMDRFEPAEALALMEQEQCTHFSGNDTMALMLLNHPDRAKRTLSLRGGWVAGSEAVLKRVVSDLGARECVAGYGLSEASPNVAQSCYWEDEDLRTKGLMRPQPGIEVRIIDPENGKPVAPGVAGEICVRGWSVMSGYFDMAQETAKTLSQDGWLSTGDLGKLDENGRLSFQGRLKNMIRVGGENVSQEDVENLLHRHPAIRHAQVVGVPDDRLVEVCAAFIILNEGQKLDSEELLTWSKSNMAGFKIPRHVWFVESFESIGMTASSKIQKSKLTDHALSLLEGASHAH